ncbi:glutathione S-transferase family protein [Pseudomonas sp. LB3P14]
MLTLLGRDTSASVQKIMWLCDECNIEFKREDVDQYAPQFLKLNPNGKIPCVIDDDFAIWESNAILQYLGTKHALISWCPTDLRVSARVRQWIDWSSCEAYRAAEPVWIGMVKTPVRQRDMATINEGRETWSRKLAILDQHLADNTYVAGDTITLCDIPLAILAYRWYGLRMKREHYPNLKRWYDSIAARPAFQKNVIDIGIK